MLTLIKTTFWFSGHVFQLKLLQQNKLNWWIFSLFLADLWCMHTKLSNYYGKGLTQYILYSVRPVIFWTCWVLKLSSKAYCNIHNIHNLNWIIRLADIWCNPTFIIGCFYIQWVPWYSGPVEAELHHPEDGHRHLPSTGMQYYGTMVLILNGNLEIGAHVRSNLCILICSRKMIRSREVTNRIFFP